MSNNQNVACPTITRFQLWDPQVLKELVTDLYAHLIRTWKYSPNEDGVCQPVCSQCPTGYCCNEAETFLTKRGLDAETVIKLLENDFHLFADSACCARGMIHTFRLEEVLRGN